MDAAFLVSLIKLGDISSYSSHARQSESAFMSNKLTL